MGLKDGVLAEGKCLLPVMILLLLLAVVEDVDNEQSDGNTDADASDDNAQDDGVEHIWTLLVSKLFEIGVVGALSFQLSRHPFGINGHDNDGKDGEDDLNTGDNRSNPEDDLAVEHLMLIHCEQDPRSCHKGCSNCS